MSLLKQIDQAAIDYNKTKDPVYKNKWYKLIKKFNASYNSLYAKKTTGVYTSADRQI